MTDRHNHMDPVEVQKAAFRRGVSAWCFCVEYPPANCENYSILLRTLKRAEKTTPYCEQRLHTANSEQRLRTANSEQRLRTATANSEQRLHTANSDSILRTAKLRTADLYCELRNYSILRTAKLHTAKLHTENCHSIIVQRTVIP